MFGAAWTCPKDRTAATSAVGVNSKFRKGGTLFVRIFVSSSGGFERIPASSVARLSHVIKAFVPSAAQILSLRTLIFAALGERAFTQASVLGPEVD